jgi:FkbM family methyltransferase
VINKLVNDSILSTKIKVLAARIPYVIASFFYGKKPRIIIRNGIKYEVDLSEGIDLSLFVFGKYQEHVTRNKWIPLTDDAIIIDIGANMGAMALPFAQIAKNGKVFAFEPTQYSLTRLKRNLELNPELASRIEVINSFVSSVSTPNANIKAFASWKVNGEKGVDVHPVHLGIAKLTEGVGSITLDEFCFKRDLAKINLIKIDTDGHEYEILLGAKETIRKYRPYLIFEAGIYAMTEKGIDFSFYLNYFKELNYRIVDSLKGSEITAINYRNYIPERRTIDVIAMPL